jgi:hypothetical protein
MVMLLTYTFECMVMLLTIGRENDTSRVAPNISAQNMTTIAKRPSFEWVDPEKFVRYKKPKALIMLNTIPTQVIIPERIPLIPPHYKVVWSNN